MNSSTDVLGQFYEVFLKYGNGAKEIGDCPHAPAISRDMQ